METDGRGGSRRVGGSVDGHGGGAAGQEAGPSTPVDPPQGTRGRKGGFRRLGPLLLGGLAGAVAVTLLNEGVRRVLPHAPRMDVIGERALAGALEAAHVDPPRGRALYGWTMAADLLSNTLYYSLVGLGAPGGTWRRGGALGLAAGVGAVVLPRPLGLGRQPGARRPRTPLLTAAWYLAGGLAAAAAHRALSGREASDA